jgi:hypothetical protein
MPGIAGTLTATVTEKVSAVDANGDYTVESVSKEGKFKAGEIETATGGGDVSKSKYSAKGDLISLESAEASSSFRLSNLNSFRYPDKPLKVGDTWTADLPADTKKGVAAAKITYKVEAAEKVDKWDTLKIKTTTKESGVSDAAESDGYNWLEVSTGVLVKSETKWTNVPLPQATGPVTAKILIVRSS